MVKKTHTQGGILFALVANPILMNQLNVENKIYTCFLIVVSMYGAYFGSVLPDIDIKSSYISKKVPLLYKLFGKHFKHRGFTHSVTFFIILWAMLANVVMLSGGDYMVKLFFYGVLVGYVSHIVLDVFTSDGVYLFAPLKMIVRLANIKTNSNKEKKLNKVLELATFMALGANLYVFIKM